MCSSPDKDSPSRKEPVTIVLVEDDPDDRMLTLRALSKSQLPHEVRCVEDGKELLDYLHGRGPFAESEVPRPDLILLDLNMPRMNGWETLKALNAQEDFRRIPTVVLTTSETDQDVLRSYDLGASAFVTKPVSFEELLTTMRALESFWFDVARLPSQEG